MLDLPGPLFLRHICAKTIDIRELPALNTFIAETMAMLGVHFPPAFWNVILHLVLYVPRELYWCGPIHARWMYSPERYIGHMKVLVKNKAKPEGSITMEYLIEDELGFVTERFCMYHVAACLVWDMEEDERDSGKVLERNPVSHRWTDIDLQQIHTYIVMNLLMTEQLYK